MEYTHDELVKRAKQWLKTAGNCPLVVTELGSPSGEMPDAIGWRHRGESILIECKRTRTDFLQDKQKLWRKNDGADSLGSLRYYLAPPDLIKSEELPDNWGLLEVRKSRIYCVVEAKPCLQNKGSIHEIGMLVNMVRGAYDPAWVKPKKGTIEVVSRGK